MNLNSIKYLVPVMGHCFTGYYEVKTIKTKEEKGAEYPIRFIVGLGNYTALPNKVQYGVDRAAARGVVMKAVKFKEHCEKFKEVGE